MMPAFNQLLSCRNFGKNINLIQHYRQSSRSLEYKIKDEIGPVLIGGIALAFTTVHGVSN